MKIGSTRSLGVATPVGRKTTRGETDNTVSAERSISDVSTVMGIPEAELTPKVRTAIMTLLEEVKTLRAELEGGKKRIDHLERLADQDTLVPVANRRAFVREMSRIMAYSQRYDVPSGVLYFDLNGMKQINDTFGHAAGDAALRGLANIFIENVRQSDVVGRLGGDEFGVILAQTYNEAAIEKAESLVQVIKDTPLIWEGNEIRLSVAYGAYCFQKGETVDDALAHADKAMYAQKRRVKSNGE